MTDLSKFTLDELRAQFVDQGNKLSVIAESRHELELEIRRRIGSASAAAKVAFMDEDQKRALKIVLNDEDPLTIKDVRK